MANDAISFELRRGEILALLGENGAGKTTLMNILFGHYVADEGTIEVFGKPIAAGSPRAAIAAGIGMVHQHFTLADNLTVLDNIVLGTESLWKPASGRAEARRRIRELGREFGLEVEPDATVATLSVGERQRVEILKALYRKASILILDEPTAVLTPAESQALFRTLRKLVDGGLSVILISHKLAEVMASSDRVMVLRAGRLVAGRAVGETSREELAELMVGRAVEAPTLAPREPGELRFELAGSSFRSDDGRVLVDNANLALRHGEIVGIAGVSGNGQTSLADFIGRMNASLGKYVAHIPEDRHGQGLIVDMSVAENAVSERYRDPAFGRMGLMRWPAITSFAEKLIAEYDIRCSGPAAAVRDLSGGNMQKLLIARVLSRAPDLVIANQPTRGLDVGAVAFVHAQLIAARDRGAALLVISEDLDELLAISDRIAVMYRGRLSAALPRKEISIAKLGLMMAGHGFPDTGAADAA
ncbi:MAG: ABC transporter ATP-binding protein [Parvibaculaceae bacterium]